jgi:hypothetical protein
MTNLKDELFEDLNPKSVIAQMGTLKRKWDLQKIKEEIEALKSKDFFCNAQLFDNPIIIEIEGKTCYVEVARCDIVFDYYGTYIVEEHILEDQGWRTDSYFLRDQFLKHIDKIKFDEA